MKYLLSILLILTFAPGVSGETQVSVSVSSTTATIGERLTLKFIVRTSEKSDSIKISPGEHEFEFISEKKLSVIESDGKITFEKDFAISFFKTGDLSAGPFDITLYSGETVIEKLVSNSIPVNIRSILEKGDKDIKPLKDLSEMEGNPFYLLKYILFLLVLGGILFLVFFLVKRRKRIVDKVVTIKLPADVEFLNRIESLWRTDLLRTGKVKRFFLSLTESYKLFITRSYNFNAEDLTTYEILSDLKKKEEDERIPDNFDQIFLISDLSKFAKYIPSEDEVVQIKIKLLEIIKIAEELRNKTDEEEQNAPF